MSEVKKLTDEKTLEFDDDVVDLLVEFDEMGFAPTTTCPDPDECARDWRERLVCAIKRVLEELECEKHNHGVTKEFYNNSVANSEKIFAEQKAEIERLSFYKTVFDKGLAVSLVNMQETIDKQKAEIERLTEDYEERLCTAANVYQVALDEKSELQKKVDELKEERENMQAVIFGLEEDKRQLLKRLDEEFVSLKAVKAAENSPKAMKMLVESVGCVQKDTAKEIFTGIKESFVFAFIGASEDYEKGYCDALKDYDKQLRDFAKEEYDVEVE